MRIAVNPKFIYMLNQLKKNLTAENSGDQSEIVKDEESSVSASSPWAVLAKFYPDLAKIKVQPTMSLFIVIKLFF